MKSSPVILIVDDDEGHALLVRENLTEAGLCNPMMEFRSGGEVLDFLLRHGPGPGRVMGEGYLMLLDIRMPGIDGIEVLRRVKKHHELRKLPIIMLTTTDDPREVDLCHQLGCNVYIQKPVAFEKFIEAVQRLGAFLELALVPKLNGET